MYIHVREFKENVSRLLLDSSGWAILGTFLGALSVLVGISCIRSACTLSYTFKETDQPAVVVSPLDEDPTSINVLEPTESEASRVS